MENQERGALIQQPAPGACPVCGGEGVELGTLGRLNWKRCRDCGMEFHGRVTPAEVEDLPDILSYESTGISRPEL